MSDVAAAPAPVAPAPQAQPATPASPALYNHPLIPPLRQPRTQAAETPAPAAAEPAGIPAPVAPVEEAKEEPAAAAPAEEQPEGNADPDTFEYFGDDTFEVVVDGKKSEVTLSKLLASYQRNEAANARFTEAKRLETNAKAMVERMMTPEGFADVCRQCNVDPIAIADKLVLQAWEYERMTPEQKEMHDFRRDRAAHEAKAKAEQAQAEQARIAQETQAFQTRFLHATTSEMDRLRIPADPDIRNELIGRTAAHFKADLAAGYQNATPAESLALVWDEYRQRIEAHARVAGAPQAQAGKPQPSAQEQARAEAAARVKAAQVAQQAPRSQESVARDEQGRYSKRPVGMDWTAVAVPGKR